MFKVPTEVLKDSKDIINSLVYLLKEAEVDFPKVRAAFIRDAKKHVKLLKDNYGV